MKIIVWDIPTRVFHWLFALSVATAFYTSDVESYLEYHALAGFFALLLVVFRVAWGFVGNRYARFSGFLRGLTDVKTFLRGLVLLRPQRYIGHNPVVGWVILVLFALSIYMVATGYVVYGGEENLGPLAGKVSFRAALDAGVLHVIGAYLLVVLIFLHVSAALLHEFVFKESLILSMITGSKEDELYTAEHAERRSRGSVAKLFVLLAVAALGSASLLYLKPAGRTDFTKAHEPFVINDSGIAMAVPISLAWKFECASACHEGFHPSLLPMRSWDKVMGNLSDHFGDDASLDEASAREIIDYLKATSAERSTSEASRKILHFMRHDEAPVRVTETRYWIDKHSDIKQTVFESELVKSKANCQACHPGAFIGSFEDRDIKIPGR